MTTARLKRATPATPPCPPTEPPPPNGLVVTPMEIGGEPFVVFSFEHGSGKDRALTRVEKAIVRHLLEGRSNAEIARSRGRSVSTIANQVTSIFRKLGVSSRLELARRW